MAFRFRDVYDQIVHLNDEAMMLQDRISIMLGANLSNVSNRLNEAMKVVTVVTTIFMPLTLLSGIWGMNIALRRFHVGDAAQFWWLTAIMATVIITMLMVFSRTNWI